MTKLVSQNPEEREASLRLVVRRLRDEASVSDAEVARQLGRPRQLLEKQLRDDESCYLRLSDLPVLERLVPGIASALLKPIGLRVVPDCEPGSAGDILAALGATMRDVAAVTAETTTALPDGIDNAEACRIERACLRLRKTLAALEASVEASVVK